MFAALPNDVALRVQVATLTEEGAIVFSKKKLEDICYGVYRPDDQQHGKY